ncbi:unnamed protein product [Rotaria sp. Silwood1]|nr:unnamed protein product [Rotaria sp. Silwood1]
MTFKRIGKSSIVSSSQPRSVAVGDFNNDNQIDIVVANSGTHTIGIFISNGNGTFVDQQNYSTGSQSFPCSVVVNDFNNDNCLDIAVANYKTNNIGIFLGYGNGTFVNPKLFSTGSSHPLFIITGDFNNDNQSDIAVTNYGTDSIGILLGYGDGSFQMPIVYSTGYDSQPYSLAVGDFNSDDRLDIAVANYGIGNIGILLGYGNGSFANQQTYFTVLDSNPISIAVGYINNDNYLDIVVANYGIGNIGILFGYGNGTFLSQTTYSIGSNFRPQNIAIGNFDGDSQLDDVVVIDTSNDQIHILSTYTNDTFAIVSIYDAIQGSNPISVAVVDFNKDNQSDIIMANYGTNDILILIGCSNEPSARQKKYYFGNGATPGSVVISDFNNDNHLDVAVTGLTLDGIVLLTGSGRGTFVEKKEFSTGNNSRPQQLCVTDLNNDNRMDIVTANLGSDSVGVLLGQGNGTFATVMTYSTGIGSSPSRLAIGDVNKDNQMDIISSNSGTDSIGVFLGHGNGTFDAVVIYSTGIGSIPNAVTVGDINNDNHLDIVTANYYSNSISILFGNSKGAFTNLLFYSIGYDSGPVSMVLIDFNRDNNLDIAIASSKAGNVDVFFGYGNGLFQTQTTYSTGSGSKPYFIIVADFNYDNRLDIAVTLLGNDEVVIFYEHGNGSFQLARTYYTGYASRPVDLAAGDMNNDTKLEIVVSLWGTGYVAILTEYFAAKFANQTIYSTGSTPQPYSLAIGDLNNDNRSDIVVANSGTDDLAIFFGLGNGTFRSRILYSTGIDSHPRFTMIGDLNKDNHPDIITINSKHDSISVIMGYGNGTFAPQLNYSTGNSSRPSAVVIGDFNNDNRSDLLVTNVDTGDIGVFIQYDYRLFERQSVYGIVDTLEPYAVVTSDFNNDTYLDIAVGFFQRGNVGILLGHGNGSFDTMITYPQWNRSLLCALAVDDVNSDGRLDIAIADCGTNNVIILHGHGNGSFVTSMSISTGNGSQPYTIAIADFNKDGHLDIAVANPGTNNVGILLGYGNESFAPIVTYSTGYLSTLVTSRSDRLSYGAITITAVNSGSQPYAAAVDDFNNDGLADVVVANFGTNEIGILFGIGDGNFHDMIRYPTGVGSTPCFVAVSDFNNDNHSDIVVANCEADNLIIFLGFGNGTFATGETYLTGDRSRPYSVAIADLDNDNIMDIVVANSGTNDILLLYGYGNGTFGKKESYPLGYDYLPSSVAITDLNQDGWRDIVIVCIGTDNVEVLMKMC